MTFYRNKEEAGTASASFVVPDYGATVIGLGVDIASLAEPGSNGTAPTVDPAALSSDLGWLSGSLGSVAVYSRALSADDVAGAFDAQSGRFGDGLCGAAAPADPAVDEPTVPETPTEDPTVPEDPNAPVDPNTPADMPVDPNTPPTDLNAPVDPPVDSNNPPADTNTPPEPAPAPSPAPAQPPANNPSTFDNSTATVEGEGTEGRVRNNMQLTGGPELENFESDTEKQAGLRRAIVLSLNLDDSFTEVGGWLQGGGGPSGCPAPGCM